MLFWHRHNAQERLLRRLKKSGYHPVWDGDALYFDCGFENGNWIFFEDASTLRGPRLVAEAAGRQAQIDQLAGYGDALAIIYELIGDKKSAVAVRKLSPEELLNKTLRRPT